MSRTLPFLLLAVTPLAANAAPNLSYVSHSGDEPTTPQPAQGQVVGRVVLADGQAAEQVSVMVKGTTIGTSTEADGSFRLRLPAGKQTLAVAYLGYVTQEIEVDVPARGTVSLPAVTLAKSTSQLAEVRITETRSLNQRPTGVSKMPIRPLDLPQAVLTVTQQTLEQQQVLRLSDALVNTPGLYVTSTTGGVQEELGSRGFAYGSNNTFKNGVRFNNGIMPEASSLESMEVLKGSAAILYGNVAAGGVLNLVTKKPKFEQGGSLGLRVGSFGFWKPMVDVYGAVGKSDKVAYRLNTTYERGNSYRDEVQSERFYVNPSLLFKLTPKTDLVLEGDYLRDNRTPDFGIGAIDYVVLDSRTRFLNAPGARNATRQTSSTATLTSRLNDTWQVRAVGGFQRYDNELRSATRPTGINNGTMPEVKRGTVVVSPRHAKASLYGDWGRNLQRSATTENYYLAQLDLTGNFHTGFLGHTLLVGADADQYQTSTLAYAQQAYDSINVLNRSKVLGQPANAVAGYDALLRNTLTKANTRRAGFYVQDLLSISEKLKMLVGLRWSYQETPSDVWTYNNTAGTIAVVPSRRFDNAFSPRLGLVYQPLKTTSVFASYANSFQPNTGRTAVGAALAPSTFDQYELGLKNDLFNGVLSANVTAYRIVNSNLAQTYLGQVLQADGTPVFNADGTPKLNLDTNVKELAGEVTSQGVEVDVQSKPYLGWSVNAGYSYNNTAYTKSNIYEKGSRLRYNPAHTANVSLFYTFDNAVLKGLTAGVTGYYVGDKLAGRNTRTYDPTTGKPFAAGDAFKLISIPDYLLFDASLGYSYQRFSLRVKLANVLNELSYNLHDDNSVNPIAPRSFSATLAYKL
ncbi:TonB-dependent receptor [Hymenobacter jeollabukensis]|uniref:TonB-dependent siderophore receptor n=1 Tax=Hymenobacter jeollabukensis TaxID=2025313 RepID=A0A5R8WNC5_9BACT|nr:TonB-dependent receptor [Hymenobacter jeollabukensis]TLM91136.1 TonB-dependent siderophore receptor [Hymenobacter jeollabukensis]